MLRGLHSVTGQRRLSLRLAQDEHDLVSVQRLRWQVFFAEMGAETAAPRPEHLDTDLYDPLCDHLLVIDEDAPVGERVVGTYRLLRESVAARSFGFYSAGEFDLRPLAKTGSYKIVVGGKAVDNLGYQLEGIACFLFAAEAPAQAPLFRLLRTDTR